MASFWVSVHKTEKCWICGKLFAGGVAIEVEPLVLLRCIDASWSYMFHILFPAETCPTSACRMLSASEKIALKYHYILPNICFCLPETYQRNTRNTLPIHTIPVTLHSPFPLLVLPHFEEWSLLHAVPGKIPSQWMFQQP